MGAQYIFLADDDIDDQLMFEEAIQQNGNDVRLRTVYSGEQLMRELTKEEAELPDLIFLDLNMPIKNGYECLDEIRVNEKLKHIPIAIFSTSSTADDIERTRQGGANAYIRKPANFNTLKEVIALVLGMNWDYPFTRPTTDLYLVNV